MDVFAAATDRIAGAYGSLGHRLGWRFLYGPAETLSPTSRILLAGSAPGGGAYRPPVPSVEEGNAYRTEAWGDGGPTALQEQVRLLYGILAKKLESGSAASLMDETLTSNFCPFRAPSWDELHRREESVAFSDRLWSFLFDHISPKVVVCLGEVPFDHFGGLLTEKGFRATETSRDPVGWGSVTYSLARYRSESGDTLMVRLPQLSRFRIIGRPQSRRAVEDFTDEIVGTLSK